MQKFNSIQFNAIKPSAHIQDNDIGFVLHELIQPHWECVKVQQVYLQWSSISYTSERSKGQRGQQQQSPPHYPDPFLLLK